MREFFNKIFNYFKKMFHEIDFKDKHIQNVFFYTLLFGLMCDMLFGNFFSVILMMLFGCVHEFAYCFVPMRSVDWWIFNFELYDFKRFKKMLDFDDASIFNNINGTRFNVVLLSIIVFLIISIIF